MWWQTSCLATDLCQENGDSEVFQMIWRQFGRAQVDLFASETSTHCPLWFSWTEKSSPLGQDALAHAWSNLLLYAFPPNTLNSANSSQNSSREPQDAPSGTELARETLVSNVMPASQWGALEPTQEAGPAPSVAGADLAPKLRSVTSLCLAAEDPELLLKSCDVKVQNIILNSRAHSTRNIYACRWKIFTDWCTPRSLVPDHQGCKVTNYKYSRYCN